MLEPWKRIVLHRPWWVIIISLIALGLMVKGGNGLHFSTDYRVFFGKTNPQLQAFEDLQQTYNKSDSMVFVLAPNDADMFVAQNLQATTWLTKEAWQLPYSIRVESLSNYQHISAQGDDFVVADLVEEGAELSGAKLTELRNIALNEPSVVNRLVSPSSHVGAVYITIQLPGKDANEVAQVMAASRSLKVRFEQRYPSISVHLTGIVALNNAFVEATNSDIQHLLPLMFLVIVLMLLILFRSFRTTAVTVFSISLVVIATMGMWGWLNGRMTALTGSSPTIVLTIAIASAVHLLSVYRQFVRQGQSKVDAMAESLRVNFQPIFLTSLTTAIGFLSLNFSDVPPLHDLGNIVAIGVVLAALLTVTFLPALMMVVPFGGINTLNLLTQHQPKKNRRVEQFAEFVISRRRPILLASTLITLVLVAMIPLNRLDDQLVNYFDHSIEFRRATDFYSEHLSGIYTIELSMDQGQPSGVADPAFLQTVDTFSDWLREQSNIVHVSTITDTFKRLNKSMHGGNSFWYKVPEKRDLAAQYLLFYEMSLPYGLDLGHQLDVDKSATRLIVTLTEVSAVDILAVEKTIKQWLQQHAPELNVKMASSSLMFSHINTRNIVSCLSGAVVALVIISFILVFALRSFKLGLVSIVPNLLPAGVAFGVWALTSGVIGVGLSVVLGMTLGIVVDDTVHFLSKYLYARRNKNMSAEDSVRYAFSIVGNALWMTTIVLVAGFTVLALSSYKMNSDMGAMTAMTIGFALLIDCMLLPALLITLDTRAKQTRENKLPLVGNQLSAG